MNPTKARMDAVMRADEERNANLNNLPFDPLDGQAAVNILTHPGRDGRAVKNVTMTIPSKNNNINVMTEAEARRSGTPLVPLSQAVAQLADLSATTQPLPRSGLASDAPTNVVTQGRRAVAAPGTQEEPPTSFRQR